MKDKEVEAIARVCHEANRTLCQTAGDSSQPLWVDAPDWQKESAIDGVFGILDGSIKSPEESHESWFKFKEADGWVYGSVKDPDMKTHPCMVPYNDLPEHDKKKDVLFKAIVDSLK